MKDWMVDPDTGDLALQNGRIATVTGGDETAQKLRLLIGTNRGEWWLDESQGIHLRAVLQKHPNFDLIQNEIQTAMMRLAEGLTLTGFTHRQTGRRLHIAFTAETAKGEAVPVEMRY